jgi:hypothetical protein
MVYRENKLLSKWFFVGFAIIAVALFIHIIMLAKIERKLTVHAGD